jgi:uncharacterized protein YheU (UPF0270 family)
MRIVVPPGQLSTVTLQALIEEFVTRQGAIHGHSDTPLEGMVQEVGRRLERGEAVIVFDEESESCTIVRREEVTDLALNPPEEGK